MQIVIENTSIPVGCVLPWFSLFLSLSIRLWLGNVSHFPLRESFSFAACIHIEFSRQWSRFPLRSHGYAVNYATGNAVMGTILS